MSSYVDPVQLNLAHSNRKYPPLSWVLLALSGVLFALSMYPLQRSLKALDEVGARQREFSQNSKRQAESARKEKLLKNSSSMLELDKAQRLLQSYVHMSWDGVFDAFEVAANTVRSGVSILVLAPTKVEPSSIELTINAVASNAQVMLVYLNALKSDPRVVQVELTAQQPDEKSGLGVVRFQFNVVCNPNIVVDHPARPPHIPAVPVNAPSTAVARPSLIVPPAVLNNAVVPGLLSARKP